VWVPDRDDHGLTDAVVIPREARTVNLAVLDSDGFVVADPTNDERDDSDWHWHYTITCRRTGCRQNLSARAERLHEALVELMEDADTPLVEVELTAVQRKIAEIGTPS
jgi:hypothetical protein